MSYSHRYEPATGTKPAQAARQKPLDPDRFPRAVETAAYLVIAEAAKAGAVTVAARRRDGVLVVDVEADGELGELVELEDRIGALDGRLDVERMSSGVKVRAEIPCG
jgi:hypothetical protein